MKCMTPWNWDLKSWIVAIAAVTMAGSGCASLKSALGMKMSLEDQEVEKMEVELVSDDGLCPGEQSPMIVSVHLEDDEEVHKTQGAGDGRVGWDNFFIEPEGVEVYEDGVVSMTSDAYEVLDLEAVVYLQSLHHEDEPVKLEVPSRFDCEFDANFSGESGRDGAMGQSGSNGSHGTDQQSSGTNAGPGGRGGDGQDGRDGGHGEAGRDGHEVVAEVALVEDTERPLLEVYIESRSSDATGLFIVDPEGGSIDILARGGRGGHGGNGGSGGSGGSGGTGSPPGDGGNGGHGGDGGNGADGGNGGSITVFVDEDAEPYLDAVSADTSGGAGGQTGSGGTAGSGGNAHSGANSGQRGHSGQPGNRNGRDGSDGPRPEFVVGD